MVSAEPAERHLLVIDDDRRLGRLLQRYLGESGYRVTVVGSLAEARAALRGLAFDLLVLDVMLPDGSGVDLASELRRESEVPILLLTARGEAEDRIGGFEAGADDYLVKPFEPRELLLRIATILRRAGRAEVEPNVVRFGPFALDPAQGELRRDGALVRLTGGELSLLLTLARRPGQPVSRAELGAAGRVSGSDRAVDTQIARLRRKLEADPGQPRYLLTMRGEGYVLRTGG
jgi:two-component system, OmpR family, phosphate regulon response regulator OmpR